MKVLNQQTQDAPVGPSIMIELERQLRMIEVAQLAEILDLDIQPMKESSDETKIMKGYFCDRDENIMIELRHVSFDAELLPKIECFIMDLPS